MEKLNEEILEFYKKTSTYTDLGYYSTLAQKLPDDIQELCLLQRKQMIHPINLKNKEIRKQKNNFFGDMTQIPITRLNCEDDIYPTALSMFSELIRKEENYHLNRKITNKIHITCRGQAILLVAILKAKGIPARVRSGFTLKEDSIYHDHWISEYYEQKQQRWIMVDADMCCNDIDYNPYDIPKDKFLLAANAYLDIRKGILGKDRICNAGITNYEKREEDCYTAILLELIYDFHCLMNDEIIYLHSPKYMRDKKFELSEKEYKELDELATLMLEPDKNFTKLQKIWENDIKYRILSGALN